MTLTHNQQYFKATKFIYSILELKNLPAKNSLLKEILIVGRSNCGKSSIINAVTNKQKLANVSKMPGRTQAINYFQISNSKYLVDLPGYGYAKVPSGIQLFWKKVLERYISIRRDYIYIILIMDIRHAFKDLDLQMLDFCSAHDLPVHIVLNKSDKISKKQLREVWELAHKKINDYPFTCGSIQTCSAMEYTGIEELQGKIIQWLD